jgi:hypothetical protein
LFLRLQSMFKIMKNLEMIDETAVIFVVITVHTLYYKIDVTVMYIYEL